MKILAGLVPLFLMAGLYCLQDKAMAQTAEADPDVSGISVSAPDVSEMLTAVHGPVAELYRARILALPQPDMLIVDQEGSPVTLRLYGADAPEKGQPGHDAAKAFAVERFLNADVDVYVFASDTLHFPVALVVSESGDSLAHQLVAEGRAWWDQANAPRDSLLRNLGANAIIAGKGIFADPLALAPWDYRAGHDIEKYSYAIPKEAPLTDAAVPKPSPEGEEPRELRAKGDMTDAPARRALPSPTPPVMLRPEKIDANLDPAALMLQHQPRMERDASGKVLGLTASNIAGIPYAAQLGFREGDIIASVNGIRLESEAQIMSLVPQFKDVKQFQVEVLRNGRPVTLPIMIP